MNSLELGILPNLKVDEDFWLNEFCKKYPLKRKGIQNPRGSYKMRCVLDSYNNLIDIKLPSKQKSLSLENANPELMKEGNNDTFFQ